jgi:hypothetical protein
MTTTAIGLRGPEESDHDTDDDDDDDDDDDGDDYSDDYGGDDDYVYGSKRINEPWSYDFGDGVVVDHDNECPCLYRQWDDYQAVLKLSRVSR